MTVAFEASYERVAPSMIEDDWNAVRTHTAVAYVLSPPIPHERAADISGLTLLLTAALLEGGGAAAKGEASGIAHGRSRWLQFAADFVRAIEQGDAQAAGASLHRAWVRRPLLEQSEAVYYSCGMQLLGLPDVEIERFLPVKDALEWMDLLGLYLVADRPKRSLSNGDGFRLGDNSPRRVMRFRSCERYEDDSFLFNPYGYIRLEPDQAS